AGEVRIVLDDQQHLVVRLDDVAVVLHGILAGGPEQRAVAAGGKGRGRGGGGDRRADGSGVVKRQIQREGAALAVHAGELDLAAEQGGELAADREAETGAAVFARGAGVG